MVNGNGNDHVDGGPGFDGSAGDSLAAAGVEGRAGNDIVIGGEGADFVVGDSGMFLAGVDSYAAATDRLSVRSCSVATGKAGYAPTG